MGKQWNRPAPGECGKHAYATKEEAVRAMFRIRSKRVHPARRAYFCQACDRWHLSGRGDTPSDQLVMLQRFSEEKRHG